LGGKFQIWNPDKFADFRANARNMALEKRTMLRSLSAQADPPGSSGQ